MKGSQLRSRIAVGVFPLLLLAGCTATSSAPAPSPTPSPSDAVPDEGHAVPTPRVALECDDLAALDLAPMFATDILRQPAAAVPFPGLSNEAYILAAGGLSCIWSDGSTEWDVDSEQLFVKVVPADEAAWQDVLDEYANEQRNAAGDRFDHSCALAQCHTLGWMDGYLVDISSNSTNVDQFHSGADLVFDAVAALDPAQPYLAPADAAPLTLDACAFSAVASAVLDERQTEFQAIPTSVIHRVATETFGYAGCSTNSSEPPHAFVAQLSGAAAYIEPYAVSLEASESVDVSGADGAHIQCHWDGNACDLEVSAGGHWIHVGISNDPETPLTRGARGAAIELAEAIVADAVG